MSSVIMVQRLLGAGVHIRFAVVNRFVVCAKLEML